MLMDPKDVQRVIDQAVAEDRLKREPNKPRLRLSFEVRGTPIPQGSKRAWYNEAAHKVMMTEDAGVRHSTWRNEVTGQARQAMSNIGRFGEPYREAISCSLTFQFHRPLIHYGTGKNAETVKLTRAIWDSLTSVVWVDDSQVVAATIRKQFVERWQEEGVLIHVGTFDSEDTDGIE
jgi:Holliday junction resolvase RusA-like endonuclease